MAGNYRPRYVKTEEWKNTGTREVMVFHPTLEEMADFSAYIEKVEKEGAHLKSGICKIVPPPEWQPRPKLSQTYDDLEDYEIVTPVKETISKTPLQGAYTKQNQVYRKKLNVRKFRELALSAKYANPRPDASIEDLERHYWRNITFSEPIYGADTPGSCFESSITRFNVAKLGTILDLLKEKNIEIPGVTSTYLYFGMYKTTFAMHVEDCDLYSINYLHYGEPKFWYGIPQDEANKVEKLFVQKFSEEYSACSAFIRHKTSIVTPNELKRCGINYGTMVQYPGEFMITFPRGYHMGFNLGYNCAESTNFATDRWIDYGKNASICKCAGDSVEVDMRPFMKKYRPDEYEEWHTFWYGTTGKKKNKSISPPASPIFPVVELPPVRDRVLEKFAERLRQAAIDYNLLWHHQYDFREECLHNKKLGTIYPHCSLCQYFVPQNEKENQVDSRLESARYVTDELYSKQPSSSSSNAVNLPLNDRRLVQCKRCSVVVHAECLNLTGLDLNSSSESNDPDSTSPPKRRKTHWKCKRCEFANEELIVSSIRCVFCPLRGGILIPHNSANKTTEFVHLVCALMSRRTKIVRNEGSSMHAVSLPENWRSDLGGDTSPWEQFGFNKDYLINDPDLYLTKESGIVKCNLCSHEIADQFVKCEHCHQGGQRKFYFHASCTFFSGVTLEHRDFPMLASAACPCHSDDDKNEPEMEEKQPAEEEHLMSGEKVVFYMEKEAEIVTVSKRYEAELCHVEFPDGSYSEDVNIEDIIDCECKKVGCDGRRHISGWIVTVRWEDESTFKGYFRSAKRGISYIVQTASGPLNCSRKPLYQIEQLSDAATPTKVKELLEQLSMQK